MSTLKRLFVSTLFVSFSSAWFGCGPVAEEPLAEGPLALQAAGRLCPDYAAVLSEPAFEPPLRVNFRNFANTILSGTSEPFHMVHDELAPEGQDVLVTGKFDYNVALHKDLENEDVHVYVHGTEIAGWRYLGEYQTDTDGKVFVTLSGLVQGDYVVRMVVEGDLSETRGYITIVKSGAQTVLFDIDATLTVDDFVGIADYLQLADAPARPYAVETVRAYVERGYQIVFLTARKYWQAKGTRAWLERRGLYPWHMRTNADAELFSNYSNEAFKRDYIQHLLDDVGLDIVRAYGNADSDIAAYLAAGIPADDVYIAGELGGSMGTNALGDGYEEHLQSVVAASADASCVPR